MGYLETIGVCACDHECHDNYLEGIENGCKNVEPEREKGYLGWFLNLSECLEAYPNPRKGFAFNNVETRSVWIYDGAHWRNTTQGNPFHLIYDIENAGEVKRGYAQSFYYVPTEEDVNGGTITFHFLVDGKDMWVECDVEYLSDIVLIEWTGSDFVSRVRSLDERVAYVEDGKVVDGSGNVVVNPAVIQSGLKVTVQYVPQSKSTDEQMQARKNIGAIGVSTMSNGTAVLEHKGQTIHPYVPASKIPTTNGKSIEQRVADEESRAQSAEKELKGGLNVTVQYVPQTKSSNEQVQARKNIGAIGVSTISNGTAVLESNGQTIYPYVPASKIPTANGKSIEDALHMLGDKAYIWELTSLEIGDGAILGEVTQEVLDALTQAQVVVLKSTMDGVKTQLVGNTKVSSNGSLYIVFDMHFVNRLVQYLFNFAGTTYSLVSIESPIISETEWEYVKSFPEYVDKAIGTALNTPI